MAIIRQARTADARSLAGVEIEAWRTAYAGVIPDHVLIRMSLRQYTARWLRDLGRTASRQRVLVAENDRKEVIAFGGCGPKRGLRLPYAGEIYTLYVAPDYQQQGVGGELLHHLFDGLIGDDLDSAMVWVLAANPARFFYEAMGGHKIAERDERLWNETMRQAAYGWDDLKAVRARSDAQRR